MIQIGELNDPFVKSIDIIMSMRHAKQKGGWLKHNSVGLGVLQSSLAKQPRKAIYHSMLQPNSRSV